MSLGWKTIAYQRSYYNIYGELSTGHRDKGTPQKIYKVTLKTYLATCNIEKLKIIQTETSNCVKTSAFFLQIKNSLCLYLIYSLVRSNEVGWSNKVDGTENLLEWV